MQLVKKYEIQSKQKIINFLNSQSAGRVASIDKDGCPQVIPMNFVYAHDAIYMHSHPFGEKLDNIRRNPNVGFEVDQHICFLPSYYFHPTDASQADTLYISVVIKGKAQIVDDSEEKAKALNALMEKYQKEGRYEAYRLKMAKNIIEREGLENARPVLAIMCVEVASDGSLKITEDPVM
ncbi:MAG: pyridoxamine 5'-phosphate oxidase family protein [Thaumarchaeota archaeon]|nr:MAG: pyridoxamine 5'-phosphate oxidase family protein [Nitrososphaerota archaeon]